MTLIQSHAEARPRIHASALGVISVVGMLVLVPLFILAMTDAGRQATLWENAHWTVSSLLALAISACAATDRTATAATRRTRLIVTLGLALYAGGSLAWDVQVAAGLFPVPSIADVLFLGAGIPIGIALVHDAASTRSRGEIVAIAMDGATLVLTVAGAVLFVYGSLASGSQPAVGLVLLAYPIVFIGLAAFTLSATVGPGTRRQNAGPIGLAVGLLLTGVTWTIWLQTVAGGAYPRAGDPINVLSSLAVIIAAVGVALWGPRSHGQAGAGAARGAVHAALPGLSVVFAAALIIMSSGDGPDGYRPLVDAAAWSIIAIAIARQTVLLRERTSFLTRERAATGREQQLRADAERALAAESASERRYRTVVSVFGRLGEQLTFAADEHQMLSAAAAAVRGLYGDIAGEVQLLNSSRDRLTVALSWGDDARAVGTVPDLESPLSCFGIRRSAPYLVKDAAEMFAVTCPALPARSGAVLCLPMVTNGQPLGVIHLHHPELLDDDEVGHGQRIAEQLALAIANARLLKTMENLALTDPLTGLYNARFFDPYLERELVAAQRDGQAIGLVMIDLDHFKAFNDTHGHPAGDQALRAFADVASATIRRSDTLARYGGEEFILLVRDADLATTASVVEKVRVAIEAVVVDLGPDRHGRLTASFGVAGSGVHGYERRSLVRTADRALYRAKAEGRNRIVVAAPSDGLKHDGQSPD